MNDRPEPCDWPEPVQDTNKKDFKGPNVRIPYELETVSSTRVINVRPLTLP